VPRYDQGYEPPAPIADVVASHPTAAAGLTLRGKLDSGADVSVLPERVVGQLGLTPKGHVWTRGYDGTFSRRPIYYVRLALEGHELAVVRCISAPRATVLLGRNVLNRFVVTLDGPALAFTLARPRSSA
jgi:predicted aspartyl protease